VIGLLRSEALRFRSRRLVVVLTVLVPVGTIVSMVIAVSQSSRLELSSLSSVFMGTWPVMGIVALVMGASVMAASYQTGTITTILTWEPRRARWYITRAVVVGVGTFLLTLGFLAFLGLAMWVATSIRGSTEVPGHAWLRDLAGIAVRVAAVAAAHGVIGAAVAAIGRHTSAALGVVFVYFVVVENVLRGFWPTTSRWLLGDNLNSFVNWLTSIWGATNQTLLTPARAGGVVLAYTVLLLIAGMVFVRARDVQ
jgi:hypothetical protein